MILTVCPCCLWIVVFVADRTTDGLPGSTEAVKVYHPWYRRRHKQMNQIVIRFNTS